MSVVVVGLEQSRSSLQLLEQVAIAEDDLPKALAALRSRANLSEVVVLSTCLRTELYAVADRFHEAVGDLQELLAAKAGTSVDALADSFTVLFDDLVPAHLFEVAAGLRSAVVGEAEVLGQVRRAAECAEAERASGPVLSALFRRAVQTGRKVRSTTAISQGTTSLAHIAVDVAAERLGGLADRSVVVIGAGQMGEGVVRALGQRGADVAVVNRTASRAAALAATVGGRGAGITQLTDMLAGAEAVMVTTGASGAVLGQHHLLEAAARAAARRGPAVVVVDLAVPRNVQPDVAELPGVELLDMDDLRARAASALEGREAEVEKARDIVAEEVERYRADSRARGAGPLVAAMRAQVEAVRQADLQRYRGRLDLDEEQWDAVDSVTRDVLAKVLHRPTVVLKESAGSPRGERLVEAVRMLFDL